MICDNAVAETADRIAPEHLQLSLTKATLAANRFRNYGSLFVGVASAEVLGDWGAGPNHVRPTGGTARFASGLSAGDFLVTRTWFALEPDGDAWRLAHDAHELAGLEGHARAAQARARTRPPPTIHSSA